MKKQFLTLLDFTPKEGFSDIYIKKYISGYTIEVDFKKQLLCFGNKIRAESKTTQNFSQEENWVVLECVNRLLEKGYSPEDIILEKTYKLGHINKGRLDIIVQKNGKTFLMIECKTWGKELEKEFRNIHKDGGQLFSYFQQDRDTEYLVLYASNEQGEYKNEIIKVEEHYKETTSVVDFYARWNKQTKQNGIFESWIPAYRFESRALTKKELKPIKQQDASVIFNEFLEILRKNTVSDKPNAFNKIFTLFLCKIYDEGNTNDENELGFQWIEGKDTHIDFQLRLTDLYKKGMKQLLEKEVTDMSNEEFNDKYGSMGGMSEEIKKSILKDLSKIRLEKNNEFSIKDVFDSETFLENAIVLKEVVELLQVYQIRYEEKQPFLGDFFELLLTTGLKQEAGQFFTPVPIAKFICKSIPIQKIIEKKLQEGNPKDLLPATIDYAAGSGHFLTESMEEIQAILKTISKDDLSPDTARRIKSWEGNFEWAFDYMYGIEKDYRLVKTAKVGCFLHGDGIANVIHGDGLDSFQNSKKYRGLLEKFSQDDPKENAQFDLVLSNPPYSVGAFKSNLKEYAKNDFELFSKLTEYSSEIEALFIERTSQLLKEGGIASIILPSSILSNTGIYTKAREIILKDFDIIAMTELGSNTFLATGTNTVTLFLRKRNKYFSRNQESLVAKFFIDMQDITLNGIERAVSKYVSHVWEGINFDDYISLVQKRPNQNISRHDIYRDYVNTIKLTKKSQDDRQRELLTKIITIEQEKLLYFVLTYPQQLVIVKTGEKKAEKEFLGYEFSNRKGREGIHPIQRGKQIDDCTQLFDPNSFDNPQKASTYIYDAFQGDFSREISTDLKKHIFRVSLSDLLAFDRVNFEKTISLSIKKKVRYEDVWETSKLALLGDIADIKKGKSITSNDLKEGNIPVIAGGQKPAYYHNESNRDGNIVTVSASGAYAGFVNYFNEAIFASDCNTILSKDEGKIPTKLIYEFLKSKEHIVYSLQRGQAQPHVYGDDLSLIKIPLPPKDIQQKIIDEIGELDEIEKENSERIGEFKGNIENLFEESINSESKTYSLSDSNIFELGIGKRLLKNEILEKGTVPVYSANVFEPFGFVNDNLLEDFSRPSVLWGIDGDWMVNYIGEDTVFYPTDHCGFLRIKKGKVDERFAAYFLHIEGREYGFSRTKRASIDRIQNIKIKLPPLETQKQIVAEIEVLEGEIEKLQAEVESIPEKKKEILKKYL